MNFFVWSGEGVIPTIFQKSSNTNNSWKSSNLSRAFVVLISCFRRSYVVYSLSKNVANCLSLKKQLGSNYVFSNTFKAINVFCVFFRWTSFFLFIYFRLSKNFWQRLSTKIVLMQLLSPPPTPHIRGTLFPSKNFIFGKKYDRTIIP